MSNSTITVGLPVPKESTALLLISTLQRRNRLDGRLGTYAHYKNEEGKFVVTRTLTQEERVLMEQKCLKSGHGIHRDGYCVHCHKKDVSNEGITY